MSNNLKPESVVLLNLRIKNEELSSRIYLQMSNELNFYGYAGAAKLWKKYSDEEKAHAEKVYEFLLDNDHLPETPALEKVKTYDGNFIEIIKASYLHEQQITKECSDLYVNALKVGDILTVGLAQWFVNEQVEELAKSKYWLDRLEAFGDSKEALRFLDNEMGKKA